MTTTAAKMIGHTLTVERIVDVPELAGTVLYRQATTNAYSGPVLAFIERRDGAFVACHGTNDQRDDLHPYNDHWTNCRLLAENLSGLAGPYEDLRYVSLTVGETLPAGVAPAKQAPMAPAETRTEYAIRLTAVRHGKWQTVIETVHPDHATDREWVAERVADRRAWQDASARTPDAELISRTVTISEWAAAFTPNQVIDAANAIRNVTNPLFKGRPTGRDHKAMARFAAWPGASKETAKLIGMVLDGTILLPIEDALGVYLFQAMNELPMVSEDELEAWTPDWESTEPGDKVDLSLAGPVV